MTREKIPEKRSGCCSCGVRWMGTGEDPDMNKAYVFFIYMFGFIVPLAIIFTCYLKIIKTIKLKVHGND